MVPVFRTDFLRSALPLGVAVSAGVAFYQPAEASSCEETLTGGAPTMDPTNVSTDVGFRCCKEADAAAPAAPAAFEGETEEGEETDDDSY